MKLSEIKHNHSLTDLLKFLIFAILMLAPFGVVATRCGYVILNKNAYLNYSDTGTTKLEGTTELKPNIEYYFTNEDTDLLEQTLIEIDTIDQLITETESEETTDNGIYIECTSETVGMIINYHTDLYINDLVYYDFVGSFTFKTLTEYNTVNNLNFFTKTTTQGYLDNVFEYSISKLEDNQLFNWTQQTAIFSPTQTMCTQLGITSNVIPQILVYWFLLTIIYVIIDIVIKIFTVLTHMIGSKKA